MFCVLAFVLCIGGAAFSADIDGYYADPNWWSNLVLNSSVYNLVYPATPPYVTSPEMKGQGLYEQGVSGSVYGQQYPQINGMATSTENTADNHALGGFGYFNQPKSDGTWNLASWSKNWRPAFLFGTYYPWSNPAQYKPILKLHANMWSYGASWPGNTPTAVPNGPWNEIGQTFVATGSSITMILFRSAFSGITWTVTIHDGGPGGPQIGPSRSITTGMSGAERRVFYHGRQVSTIPGHTYYLKLQASGTSQGTFCESEPIPDMSDPMPNGCVYHRVSATDPLVADPSRDLGFTICSDDDGIITDLNLAQSGDFVVGGNNQLYKVGQTFIAHGSSLLYYGVYFTNHQDDYVATLYDGIDDATGTPGLKIGYSKKQAKMRGGDPEVVFIWEPGECPLTSGHMYYLEIVRSGGSTIIATGVNTDAYHEGQAYASVLPAPAMAFGQWAWDLCGCIMEEESEGSATKQTVQFSTYPAVALADRGTRSMTVRWTTDVASDSSIEYGAWNANYTDTYYSSALVTDHVATISGLQPNAMYHFRVNSAASLRKTGVTRDLTACTINETPNLLGCPGFETGSASVPLPWHPVGLTYAATSFGTAGLYGGMLPYEGEKYALCSADGVPLNGVLYQTVPSIPGVDYSFTIAMQNLIGEWSDDIGGIGNNNRGKPGIYWYWPKYHDWKNQAGLAYVKIGIDPTGGADPASTNVRWTPTAYSQLHWTNIGAHATASANQITVFVSDVGTRYESSKWHMFATDDCRLSGNYPAATPIADLKGSTPDGPVTASDLIVTATTAQVGAYYAETEERTQGIRIESTETVALGSKVTVAGTLTTDPNTHERYLANAVFTSSTSDTAPSPLFMQCRNLGGAAFGSMIPAVPGSNGPHNTGLLIAIAGEATQKAGDSSYIYVNDGSLPGDGVKIDTSRLATGDVPAVDAVVSVRGVSTLWLDGSVVKPLVYPRGADDISDPYN